MVKMGLAGVKSARDRIGGAAGNQGKVGRPIPSFRGALKARTRNLEIPGSMLRIAPE